jgi:uncharacterized membrane protein YccF (DUF307 family)
MKLIGNILWFILVGHRTVLGYCVLGILWCITIVGIPFGLQLFKVARFVLFPFGKTIKVDFAAHPIANVIWLIFSGIESATYYLIVGCILCITIIGIPFGKQCFKLMSLTCIPFGATW